LVSHFAPADRHVPGGLLPLKLDAALLALAADSDRLPLHLGEFSRRLLVSTDEEGAVESKP